MAVNLFYQGPSGGTGGGIIDPRVKKDQPQFIDVTASQHFPLLNDLFGTPDARIRELIINSGESIDSITVSYVGANDVSYGSYKMGGNGGGEQIMQLQEGEFITHIFGEYSDVVKNFQIDTNLGQNIAFGTSGSVRFEYNAPDGYEIIGFWGASGALIDRVGIVLRSVIANPRG
ncbi:jacalin-like lectin [Puia dinghuensis]|uniref:Jacalin-type lectin domain-containing protein n=1 Tax=Puia dinghuensis TaxID=1792502 RepID=A0A8J2UCJ3_9BACT|nr:jacalin-like lectin [Puia dinghuensis]GGA97589.1 hypothetical protein GCM10011511_21150 [Puia dinghuensis]